MAIYFCKSLNAFVADGVNTNMPSDKVEIPTDVWQHLLENQGYNSVISSDANGNPILVNPQSGDAVVYTSVGQT